MAPWRFLVSACVLAVAAVAATTGPGDAQQRPAAAARPAGWGASPIHHVVIVYQENHSFDNVLGLLCVQDQRCSGAVSGRLHTGAVVPLTEASDLIPEMAHNALTQDIAIDGGAMDGF